MSDQLTSRRGKGRPPAGSEPVAPDEDLLQLALEAFADLGYEGASVRSLCRRMGVSHNLIHQRFRSKERLWYAAIDHGFKTLAIDLVMTAGADEQPDDLDRLRAVMVRWLELTAASPALVRIINQEASTGGPRLDHIFDHFISPVADVLNGFLRRLEQQGRVRHVPPGTLHFLVAHGAAGPLSLTALAQRLGNAPTSDQELHEYVNQVADILLLGISTDRAD